jgi:hypothetical protein
MSLEGYYREMSDLIAYEEGATFFGNDEDWQEQVETGGQGRAYGLEWLFQKKTGRLSGWIGYTLAWSERRFENVSRGGWYPYRYDRRHDIGATMSYRFSNRFSASANWVYGTGNAFSLPEGRYPSAQPGNNTNPFPSGDIFIYNERNNYRMEAYHRLDIGVQASKPKDWGKRIWHLGFYNAYNRNNPFFYELRLNDRNQRYELDKISLFPMIPYISYQAQF